MTLFQIQLVVRVGIELETSDSSVTRSPQCKNEQKYTNINDNVDLPEADPCVSYTELRDAHRSRFYRYQEEDFGRCDEKLSLAWYRFRGKAGLKMPDSCVDPGFCGTHSPGWFQGKHPSISDGIRNGNVCFNWMGECCFWLNTVMVKNCSGFYVYRLPPTIFCDLLYCGDGASGTA